MIHSRYKQLVVYMSAEDHRKLESYSKKNKISMTALAREGIEMRMNGDQDPYNRGFNDGIKKAIDITHNAEGAKMAFPSGRTFAQVVCDDIEKFVRGKEKS